MIPPETIREIAVTTDRAAFYALLTVVTQGIVAVIVGFLSVRMRQLERNTNSMREQLVSATAALNLARGRLEGRADLAAEIKEQRDVP